MKSRKLGCLLWVVLFLMMVLWGWKLIDFYVLKPAAIKKVMNETVDQVSRMRSTAARQVEFLNLWADWRRSSTTAFTTTAFHGGDFVVEWVDTLHVPVFPSIVHGFRLTRAVQ
ncbi:MAG: hypothetical protein KAR40_01665 [Candidatus Sabulitectum sp.]|nr:hypothetical protein [Candidatus Sabulitectum sp.]